MKSLNFWSASLLGLALAAAGAVSQVALRPLLGPELALRALIATLALSYLLALLAGGGVRAGRLVAIGGWLGGSALLALLHPSLGVWLLLQVGAIWLIRSLIRYQSLASALMDLALSGFAVAVALATAQRTGSLFLCLWSFFLVQALCCLIPPRPWQRPSEAADGFDQAQRTAEAALRRLASQA